MSATPTRRLAGAPATLLPAAILAALAVAATAGLAPAQTWSTEHHKAGLNGRCYGLTTWDGDLVAVGKAFAHDGDRLDAIVHFDGNTWRPIGAPNSYTGAALVRTATGFGGDLVAAGEFSALGNVPSNSISRFDGSTWTPLGDGLQRSFNVPAQVFALAVYRGELYAGGDFTLAGTQSISGLARWDGSAWRPVGPGLSAATSNGPRVTSLLAASDGRLYIGGSFERGGSTVSPNIIAWDGATYSAVGGGTVGSVSTYVFALAEYQGSLYAGGNFGAVAGNLTVNHIARFDGQQWHPVGGGVPDWSIGVTVYSLHEYQGHLFVGGNFVEAGPSGSAIQALRVARWDGQNWSGIGGISGSDLTTTALAMTTWNGRLYVGGEFTRAGTDLSIGQAVVSTSIAGWDGRQWSQVGRGLGLDGQTRKIVPWRNGWVAVGMAIEAGRSLAPRVAYFDGDDWQAMGSFDGNVNDALVWNGELYVTGGFQTVDGQPIRGVARYDGTRWSGLGQGAGDWCLEVHQGQLYAGGTGGARRWNGASWEDFMPGTGGHVNDMLSLGGVLYLGGSMIGGIKAWDGANLTTVGGGTDRTVNELFDWNGRLLAGGEFTRAGTVAAGGAATWDGQQWQAVGTPITAGGFEAFAELDGVLYGGGTFTHYQGFPAQGLARLDPVTGWQPVGGDVTGAVLDLHADALRGRLLLVGGFLRAGGTGLGHVAHSMTWVDMRSGWSDLGFALPGRATPRLAARGLPSSGRITSFALTQTPPNGAGLLVAGVGRLLVPLLGGTLVPPPALTLFAATDAYGRFTTEVRIPRGVPPGTEFTAQAWLLDPQGPQGASASNAVGGTVR